MKAVKVVVIEGHRLVREMFVRLFSHRRNFDEVGQAGRFYEAVQLLRQQKPDLVILDIILKGCTGFDAVPVVKTCRRSRKSLPYPCM